ncbi:MAG TPA: hypothetical protein VGV41_18265 [Pseudolabrys sp.]|uniref:hypothetical protein n=1 Tax=Pseudolabrys sp. TaxID=1960880 RepID=UPI002DDD3C2F|nr:hypothetical protein [Pseudolabrys sp.]HEV2630572.1 hypothetical protein [Pseudolabrys sp.]
MAARETEIQASICDYLAYKRHFFFRSNNIPVFDKARGAFRALPKHTPRGVADIIVVHIGKPYFLEVKRPGTYQRPEQKEFQKAAEAAGALYAVVRSIDDIQALGL